MAEPTESPPVSDPSWFPPPDSPFWKPSFGESLRYAGWRVFLALLLIPAGAMFFFAIRYRQFVWIFSMWKVIATLLAIPVLAAVSAMRSAIQARKGPFCIHCGYALEGLPDFHFCPECGRPYSFRLIQEYQRDPAWFIERCRTRRMVPPTHSPFAAGPIRSRRSRDGT